jgi:soluble lytic murein transglycosylase-like protein
MFIFLPGNINGYALKSRFVLLAALALCSGFAQADIYGSLGPTTPTIYSNMLPAEGRWELNLKAKPAPMRDESLYDQRRFAVDIHSRYARQIQAAAMAYNVEAALIRAVISVESGYNPSAVSRAGAVGLMQLMPETAKHYKVRDRHDPGQNIRGGAQYLRDLLRTFNNDLQLTIAAYNAGEQAVMKYGNRIPPYRGTLAYVPKVMMFYKQYSIDYASAEESGDKRLFTISQKKGTQSRVSRTYMPANAS